MEKIFTLVSGLLMASIALPGVVARRRRNGSQHVSNLASAPVVTRDEGWQFVHCADADSFSQWLGEDERGLPPSHGEEPSLGSHLLVEVYGCDPSAIDKERHVRDVMIEAAQLSKATVVEESFHEFQPYGVSGAVIIQESHYTIHTWPEHRYAAIDLFYCGGAVEVHRAIDVLRRRLSPERMKFLVVRRGLRSEVHSVAQ